MRRAVTTGSNKSMNELAVTFYTFSAMRDILKLFVIKVFLGMRTVLVSRTWPKFGSKYVITDIRHYARHSVLTFRRLPFRDPDRQREYNAKEMGWEGKSLDCNLISCVNQNGLAFFNSYYFVHCKICSNKTDQCRCISLSSFTPSIRGYFWREFRGRILRWHMTSSMTTITINKSKQARYYTVC